MDVFIQYPTSNISRLWRDNICPLSSEFTAAAAWVSVLVGGSPAYEPISCKYNRRVAALGDAVSMVKPAVSVVVPAYNSAGTIIRCLGALMSQETDLPYEVIVVESSGDGAAGLVRDRFPNVRLIESPRRLLSGAARNLGAGSSRGELLLFIDSDCVAEPAWIEKMRRAHEEFDGAGVGGAVLNGNPESPVSVASYITEFSVFFDFGTARRMDYLPSCNLSYKMEAFRRHGGFDPDQPLYVDLMFNKRLSALGERLLFRPDIRIWHWHRADLREYLLGELGEDDGLQRHADARADDDGEGPPVEVEVLFVESGVPEGAYEDGEGEGYAELGALGPLAVPLVAQVPEVEGDTVADGEPQVD